VTARFDGRTVLVTGGASGIGRTIAQTFLDEGAAVFVFDASEAHVEAFLAEHPGAGAAVCDIGIPEDVEQAIARFRERHDRLDVLVNNAGIAGPVGPVEELDVDGFRRCIDVNLNGMFYVTRLAAPLLKQSRGIIVNIASNAGLSGCPGRSPYAASKWAMIGLTRTWAVELGPLGVRVNAVCTASVEGPRIDAVIENDARQRGVSPEEIRKVYLNQSSMRTFVGADDVAAMVTFLASDEAGKVSGQAIAVDGHTETLAVAFDQP